MGDLKDLNPFQLGSSLIGGAFGLIGAHQDRKFQRQMYERQKKDAFDMYNIQLSDQKQLATEQAALEKQGLINAGISPALSNGSFSPPNSISAMNQPQVSGNGGGSLIADAGSGFAQFAMAQAQIQLMKSKALEAEKNAGLASTKEADLKAKLDEYNTNIKGLIRQQYVANIEKTQFEADRLRQTNPKEAARLEAEIEAIKAKVRNLDQSTQLLSVNTDTARKMQPKQLKQADLNIRQAFMNLKKTAEEINELHSRAELNREKAATESSVRTVNMATAENQYEQSIVNQWKALSEQYKTNVSKLQSAMAEVGLLDGQNEFQAGLTSALVAGGKMGVNMEVFTPLMANGAYCYQSLLQGVGASSELIKSAASLSGGVAKALMKGVTLKPKKD